MRVEVETTLVRSSRIDGSSWMQNSRIRVSDSFSSPWTMAILKKHRWWCVKMRKRKENRFATEVEKRSWSKRLALLAFYGVVGDNMWDFTMPSLVKHGGYPLSIFKKGYHNGSYLVRSTVITMLQSRVSRFSRRIVAKMLQAWCRSSRALTSSRCIPLPLVWQNRNSRQKKKVTQRESKNDDEQSERGIEREWKDEFEWQGGASETGSTKMPSPGKQPGGCSSGDNFRRKMEVALTSWKQYPRLTS